MLVQGVVRRRARQLPPPKWGDPKTLSTELGAMQYQELGSQGPQILLLHSFGPGHSGLHWQAVAEILAANSRVMVPDLLGWGGSERPSLQFTPELYADLLCDFLVEVAKEPAIVVASGRSAAIAARVATTRPELFRALGMVAPTGLEARREAPDLRDSLVHTLLRLPLIGHSALAAVTSRTAVAQHLRKEVFFRSDLAEKHVDEHYRNCHLPGSSAALAAAVCGKLDLKLNHIELEALKCPVWIAWGRHADSPNLTNADLWLTQIESAKLQIFEHSASHPHLEQPEDFAQKLHEFVAS